MKKIFIILLLFINCSTFALDKEKLTAVPTDFNSECFEYYSKVPKVDTNVIFINSNKPIDYITQDGYFISKKDWSNNISSRIDRYFYENNSKLDFSLLNDNNHRTFSELDIEGKKNILLKLDENTKIGEFSFVFDYFSSFYIANYYISDNNISFSKVDKNNINNFSFKYFKIEFIPNNSGNITREKIKISELSFLNNNRIYLIEPISNNYIEIYFGNNCLEPFYINQNEQNFAVDKNTKTINLKLDKNITYNPNSIKDDDLDNDFILNSGDNCKNIYNPDQLDSNSDGIGDACSDVDNDGIIGNIDNCPYISNPDQKDVNINGVGDVCEFDKDKDGIFDLLDNCVTNSNPDQKDDDNDGIGNSCDNCKYYNPDQRDENGNNIGDYCEKKEQELKDNDDDKDGIINFIDNCEKKINPKQEDLDKDGIGDVCDNCLKLQNTDQKDENKNGIGDFCEDIDLDKIQGYLDNCPTISNSDQKDDDNNSVGNVCEDTDNDNILFANDNCPFIYNPDQKDIDSDKIGDSCDKKDNRFVESNRIFFIGIIVFVTLVFLFGIYKTVKSLDKKEV